MDLFWAIPSAMCTPHAQLSVICLHWLTVFSMLSPMGRIQADISSTLKNMGSSLLSIRLLHWCSRGDATDAKICLAAMLGRGLSLFTFCHWAVHLAMHCGDQSTTMQLICGIPCSMCTWQTLRQRSKWSLLWYCSSFNYAQKMYTFLCSVFVSDKASNWTSWSVFLSLNLCPKATHPHQTSPCVVSPEGYCWPKWAKPGGHLHPVRPWLMTLN